MDAQQATPAQSELKPSVSQEERLFSALTYIPFLNLLTCPFAYLRKPESLFCRFHIRQGFTLFIAWFISLFVLAILPAIHAVIGGILSSLTWIGLLVLSVLGGMKAWNGQQHCLPIIGVISPHVSVDLLFATLFGKQPSSLKPAEPPAEAKTPSPETPPSAPPSPPSTQETTPPEAPSTPTETPTEKTS